MYSLGYLHKDTGEIETSIEWNTKAGELGESGSLHLLAEYLLVGKYIPKNNKLAYKYLRIAFLSSNF